MRNVYERKVKRKRKIPIKNIPRKDYFFYKKSNFIHCVSGSEMLLGMDFSKLKTDRKKLDLNFQKQYIRNICGIFVYAFKQIIEDVIMNGTEFNMSRISRIETKEKGAKEEFSIIVEAVNDETYKLYRKCNVLNGFDPLKTGFKIYKLWIKLRRVYNNVIMIPLKVDRTRRNMLMNQANSGKMKVGIVKTWKDYVDIVHSAYPAFEKSDISRIMQVGFMTMLSILRSNSDIELQSGTFYAATALLESKNPRYMQCFIARRMRGRINYLFNVLKCIWDGWMWFSLKKEKYNELKERIESGEEIDYGKIFLCRLYDMAICGAGILYNNVIMRFRFETLDNSEDKTRGSAWWFANKSTILEKKVRLSVAGAEAVEMIDEWTPMQLSGKNRNYKLLRVCNVSEKYKMKLLNQKRRAEFGMVNSGVKKMRQKYDIKRMKIEMRKRMNQDGGCKEQHD